MSYTVSVTPSQPPTVAGLAADLAADGIRLTEETAPDGAWPRDFHAHFFAMDRSTRGVECTSNGREFDVRWMHCSAAEDYEIGLRILEHVAGGTETVRGEDGLEAPMDSLRDAFDGAWVEARIAGDASALAAIVGRQGTVQLPGPVRACHVGPRLIAELDPDRDGFAERLLEAIRRVQYLDVSALFSASAMQVQAGAELRTFAAWGPEVDYFFPEVQSLLVLEGGEGEPVPVPFEALRELAPEWRWVDEVQVVVPAIPASSWAELYAKAREMRDPAFPPPPSTAPPSTAPPARRRPWWKFW